MHACNKATESHPPLTLNNTTTGAERAVFVVSVVSSGDIVVVTSNGWRDSCTELAKGDNIVVVLEVVLSKVLSSSSILLLLLWDDDERDRSTPP